MNTLLRSPRLFWAMVVGVLVAWLGYSYVVPSRPSGESRVLTLYPYLYEGRCWVFDDQRTGLKEEAFVRGMTEMISKVVETKRLPEADKGFAMSFSDRPFDGHDVVLEWQSPGFLLGGNWYAGEVAGQRMTGWLCPALFYYFKHAPRKIYVRCDVLPTGVNPIWTPAPGEKTRRFVDAS